MLAGRNVMLCNKAIIIIIIIIIIIMTEPYDPPVYFTFLLSYRVLL